MGAPARDMNESSEHKDRMRDQNLRELDGKYAEAQRELAVFRHELVVANSAFKDAERKLAKARGAYLDAKQATSRPF